MIIITELADGRKEVFKSDNYIISRPKDFHPLIYKVSIYDNGILLKSISRPFKFIYKYFIFKSEKVQTVLKNLEEQRRLAEQAKEGEKWKPKTLHISEW